MDLNDLAYAVVSFCGFLSCLNHFFQQFNKELYQENLKLRTEKMNEWRMNKNQLLTETTDIVGELIEEENDTV